MLTVFRDNVLCKSKLKFNDSFWKFWIKLYIAENQPLVRKNKSHMISLFASNNV